MSEFKGTKGNWEKITENWDLDQCVFLEGTEEKICDVKSLSQNAIYDALLISKAPEMLEILKQLIMINEEGYISSFEDGFDVWEKELNECMDKGKELIKQATEI